MNLTEVLRTFVKVGDISPHTTATLLPHLAEPVRALLAVGVGYLGDGMIRTVDPAVIARPVAALASPIHASHAYPLLTSAFGDVVIAWGSRLYLINSRLGRYAGLGRLSRLADVVAELVSPATRDFLLGPSPWVPAVQAMGMPTPAECFAYIPPLAVLPRGAHELTGVVRTDLAEHLQFLGAFYGPALGRW